MERVEKVSMEGKTVIVTGANSGIGKETARELARKGARVILACRNPEEAEATRAEIVQDTGNEQVIFQPLNLASLKSVRDFAERINQEEDRLDVLINNAGVWMGSRQLSVDGYELTFAVNHLGHFLLTNLLLDKLKASAPSRVVVVTGDLYKRFGKFDIEDVQSERDWGGTTSYSRSKTMNIMFARELAKRLEETGVDVHVLHPGVINSGLGRRSRFTGLFLNLARPLLWAMGETLMSAEDGAKMSLWCAMDPNLQGVSGQYYRKFKEEPVADFARDQITTERLWEISEEMSGLKK